MKREFLTLSAPKVRFATDDACTFSGYASVWNEPDSYGDTIKRGAFAKTLLTRSTTGGPSMFWTHDPDKPIGVWVEIVEGERGLKITGRLVTETVLGAEARALLIAGAVNGLSIGFRAIRLERGPNGGLIRAATEKLDGPRGLIGRALMLQTWDLILDGFPSSEIQIPLAPLRSVESVTFSDVNGDEQVYGATGYSIDNADEPGWLVPDVKAWPSTLQAVNVVRIRFIAGHTPGTVPECLLLAIKQRVGQMYEQRESAIEGSMHEVPLGYHDLIRDYRSWVF